MPFDAESVFFTRRNTEVPRTCEKTLRKANLFHPYKTKRGLSHIKAFLLLSVVCGSPLFYTFTFRSARKATAPFLSCVLVFFPSALPFLQQLDNRIADLLVRVAFWEIFANVLPLAFVLLLLVGLLLGGDIIDRLGLQYPSCESFIYHILPA